MASANGTTNIDDLPVPSSNNGLGKQPNGNIKLELFDKNNSTIKEQYDTNPINNNNNNNNEMRQQPEATMNNQPSNQFVSGIQRAISEGALGLPQRDIHSSQNHNTQDHQIQANYIPSHYQNGDYIKEHMSKDEIMRRASMHQSSIQAQDDAYNELQIPLLIFILYFIFNLPFVRKNVFTYLPVFFNKDGNLTGGGHLFHSVGFSIICYGVFKGFKYLSA
jgi:hypothetical protein